MSRLPELPQWFELFVSLVSGAAVIVGLAAIITRRLPIAVWQRTVWQVSTLGLALLLIAELTGVAGGVMSWARNWVTDAKPSAAVSEAQRPGSADSSRQDLTQFDEITESETFGLGESLDLARGEDLETTIVAPFVVEPLEKSTTRFDSVVWWPVWLWLIGSAVLLSRLLIGRLLLEWFRGRHRATSDVSMRERVQAMAWLLGMRRRVRVVIVRGLSGPISLGTLRPTVGLPERFAEQFDRSQQDAMLAHELGHLAAHDSAWHALAELTTALMWWHPLVWWCRRELRSASEWAADEASLALPNGAEVLAACLVSLGQQVARTQAAGWLGIEGNGFRSSLGQRVERLLSMSDRPLPRPRVFRSSLVKVFGPAVMVAFALVSTGWSRPPEEDQGETMFQSIRQSWRQSLAALMFLGAASSSDDSVLLAADDPFAPEAVTKNDAKQDRRSLKEEEDDDDDGNKKSVKGKKDDDDDRRDKKPVKKGEEDDDKRSVKRKEKEDDEKEDSLADLRARLKQLEAENAKLRNAVEEKEAANSFKKSVEAPGKEKLPAIKFTKPVDPPPQKGGEKPDSEQADIMVKLKQIQGEVARLQKEGRKEEAEKLSQVARELHQSLAYHQAKHGKEPRKDPKHEGHAIAERIQHLQREIEESTRAGRKDQAEALRQELEKLVDHAQHLQKKGFMKLDPEPHGELGAVIKELAGEVQRLRAEVNELRQIVRERDERKK